MQTILCPTDFSPVAQNAILYAAEFAQKSGAELIVFHTEFFPKPVSDEGSETINIPSEYIPELKEKFEDMLIQIKLNFPEVKVKYVVEEGLVAENIALYANENHMDLIIMGTSGATGLQAFFLGSNAVNVMEKSNCPLLIIPKNAEYRGPKLFVYASDLEHNEDNVMDQLFKITSVFDAEIELLHVQTEDTLELVDSEVSLKTILQKYGDKKVRSKVILADDSPETIEEYAKVKADILVMVNRKKNLLEKLLRRNKVEKIAYNTEVPLLVMPA